MTIQETTEPLGLKLEQKTGIVVVNPHALDCSGWIQKGIPHLSQWHKTQGKAAKVKKNK
jgi:hypothetical protein